MIKCIVIRILDKGATCDGTVHEFTTEQEYRAFADGVREGSEVCGGRAGVYCKDAYGKLPAVGNEFINEYLIKPENKEESK